MFIMTTDRDVEVRSKLEGSNTPTKYTIHRITVLTDITRVCALDSSRNIRENALYRCLEGSRFLQVVEEMLIARVANVIAEELHENTHTVLLAHVLTAAAKLFYLKNDWKSARDLKNLKIAHPASSLRAPAAV